MSDALVDNASDPTQVRNARQTEKLRQRQAAADLKSLVENPAFMRYAARLLEFTGFMRSEYRANPNEMAFHAGQRNVGLRVFSEISEAHPAAIAAMMQPTKERK
jgi:hypothetical protein